MKKVLSLLIVLILSCPAYAADLKEDNPAAPQKRLISLDFQETPISTVLDVLSMKTGFKFITDSELARRRVIFTLKDVSPEEALNALLDTYNLYYVRQANTDIYVIKAKQEGMVRTVSKVIYCNYSSAFEVQNALRPKLTTNGSISSDNRSNTIIVTDMADNVDKIEQIVRELDTPPLQVVLEAKIVDVKIDSSIKTGVNITDIYKKDNIWVSPLDLKRAQYIEDYKVEKSVIMPETTYRQNFAPGGAFESSTNPRFGIALLTGDYSVQAAIEALKTSGDAKVLTNPKLLVINNQEATIDIVEQIPYKETSASAALTVTTIQFKDVGIKLRVRPMINREGVIVLSVAPEQSFRAGELDGIPIINTSRANTTFMMKDGETAVIGGLIRESDSITESKVPLLGDIPILGLLFKQSSKTKARAELTIFITARIVKQ